MHFSLIKRSTKSLESEGNDDMVCHCHWTMLNSEWGKEFYRQKYKNVNFTVQVESIEQWFAVLLFKWSQLNNGLNLKEMSTIRFRIVLKIPGRKYLKWKHRKRFGYLIWTSCDLPYLCSHVTLKGIWSCILSLKILQNQEQPKCIFQLNKGIKWKFVGSDWSGMSTFCTGCPRKNGGFNFPMFWVLLVKNCLFHRSQVHVLIKFAVHCWNG
jgi:hypothetical protein